ncbi:MAG: nuclear transport factor 2 family protein [Maribacter sp.]|uniref:nuclear transport factor 2 family protein n=1 Tax=Maribacter sp. TaxID=1897614 RepID=UPI003C713AAD
MMKKTIRLFSVLTSIVLMFTACSTVEKPAPLDMATITAEIQAMEDAFAAAEKAKDADAVAVYYSEDAISYSRNTQPVSGRAAIRDKIAQRIANDTLGTYNVYKVVDLFAEGNSAVEIGSWTEFNTEGTETENGYYMSYFEKRDGKYECVRDMSLTTMPEKEGM